jgi:hypothetical protein
MLVCIYLEYVAQWQQLGIYHWKKPGKLPLIGSLGPKATIHNQLLKAYFLNHFNTQLMVERVWR